MLLHPDEIFRKREIQALAVAELVHENRDVSRRSNRPRVTQKDTISAIMKFTRKEIHAAQAIWGDGVVSIGAAKMASADYTTVARHHVETLYAYQLGPVLFKPTKVSQYQFRSTAAGALSYFVGGDEHYPEDKGFALQPWLSVRFENAEYLSGIEQSLVMGNYYFTDVLGDETKVEFTFGYCRDEDGRLRINVHHSSLPFSG